MRISQGEFERIVEEVLAELPESFSRHLENVTIDIEDEPDAPTLEEAEMDEPRELLGFYVGVPLTLRHVDAPAYEGDRILLFQRNIERASRSMRQIREQIRVTLLHEIGHHFGMDEDELDELGYG
jgi:predicted Zn-dependent protease with MMP-like domain